MWNEEESKDSKPLLPLTISLGVVSPSPMQLPFFRPVLKQWHLPVFGRGLYSHSTFSTPGFHLNSEITSPARLISSDQDPCKDSRNSQISPFLASSDAFCAHQMSVLCRNQYSGLLHYLGIFLPWLLWHSTPGLLLPFSMLFLFSFAHPPMKNDEMFPLHAFSPHSVLNHLRPSFQQPPI